MNLSSMSKLGILSHLAFENNKKLSNLVKLRQTKKENNNLEN